MTISVLYDCEASPDAARVGSGVDKHLAVQSGVGLSVVSYPGLYLGANPYV